MQELYNPKWRSLDDAVQRRLELREAGKRVVLTNGCFDLLHTGHLYYLQQAAQLGDALFIALNGEESVRALKGPSRPVQDDQDRAFALAALACVDTIIVFDTPRLTAEIEVLRPDLYCKAGDYTLEKLDKEERAALEAGGADIRFIPFLKNYSTTSLIERIKQAGSL